LLSNKVRQGFLEKPPPKKKNLPGSPIRIFSPLVNPSPFLFKAIFCPFKPVSTVFPL